MKRSRTNKIIWSALLILGMFFGILCPAGSAEAKAAKVETAKYGWTWTFWGEPEVGDMYRTLRFGRCTNRETGEYLSDGWHLVDDHWYYFTPNGYARDQFHEGYPIGDRIGLGTFEKDDTPVRYKWVQTSNGRYRYQAADGSNYLKSRKAWIDAQLFMFDSDGYLPEKAGWWMEEGTGTWYYILPSLACATGWKKIGGKWYFFDFCTGHMAEWGSYDTRVPFAKKACYYVFDYKGAMRTTYGWMKGPSGEWYFANKSGTAALGWRTSGGKDYYLEPGQGGRMAVSGDSWTWYQAGRKLDEKGIAGEYSFSWHQAKNGLWWYGNMQDYAADGVYFINGWGYEFSKKGYALRAWRLSDNYEEVYYHEKDDSVVRWDDPIEVSEADLYLLAATVYTEAGGEDYIGQVAVANVVLNRLRSGKYGDTLSDVIYAPYQFSVVGTKTFRRCLIHGGSAMALKAAKEALAGKNVIGGYDSFRMHEGYDLKKIKTEYMIHGCHVFYYMW